MTKSSLNYEPEIESIEKDYLDVFSEKMHDFYALYEAESEADFLKKKVYPLRLVSESVRTDADNNYFVEIADCFKDKGSLRDEDSDGDTTEGADRLEALLQSGLCRINDDDSFLISPKHPILRTMDEYFGFLESEYLEKYVNVKEGNDDSIKTKIIAYTLENFIKQKERIFIYGREQVYCSDRTTSNKCRKAVSWSKFGSLTEIYAIQIIDKIKAWLRNNVDIKEYSDGTANVEVKIAHFGSLSDKETLINYFDENNVVIDNTELKCGLSLVELQKMENTGEYYYEIAKTGNSLAEDVKRVFNLMSSFDVRYLFENFNIVLFLDESFFYKQGQGLKTLDEKEEEAYIGWQGRELKRTLDRNSLKWSMSRKIVSEMLRGVDIYEKAGKWINGIGEETTRNFSFDKKLFRMLSENMNSKCDVYLYISRGTTVADSDLSKDSLCKSERFNGDRLLVYRMPYRINGEESTVDYYEINDWINRLIQTDDVIAEIDVWRLVKGVGDGFWKSFVEEWDIDASISKKIERLRQYHLIIRRMKGDDLSKLQIELAYIRTPDEYNYIKNFLKAYLDICTRENYYAYLREYLLGVFTDAMVSRASSMEGIFCAHFINVGNVIIDKKIVKSKKKNNTIMDWNQNLSRARNSIASAITGLDEAVIRYGKESRRDALKRDFRYTYCKDIKPTNFDKMLSKLHRLCEIYDYTGSRLYMMTE